VTQQPVHKFKPQVIWKPLPQQAVFWGFLGREWKTTNPFNYQLISLVVNFRGDNTKYAASGFIVGALVVAVLLVVVWSFITGHNTTNKTATTNAPTVKSEAVNAVVCS
jgi:hypothetical protein